MNPMKNSKRLFLQWFPLHFEKISFHSKHIHRKSLPPLQAKSEGKQLVDCKTDDNYPVKPERVQRDIFGATILPQNLSFENSKKLTENQVRLEDIPLVDENDVAEAMLQRRMKGKRANPPKEETQPASKEDYGVIVIDTSLMKQPKDMKQPTEVLYVADSYEDIPGPRFFQGFISTLKTSTRQLTVMSLLRLLKSATLNSLRSYGPIIKLPEILGGKIVLVSRPEHISAIFDLDHRYPINSTLDSIQRSRLQRRGKNEQTRRHLTEEEWENLRTSVKEPAMRGIEKYFEGIDEASGKFLRRIKTIRNRQNEVPDDFLFEINKWSLECLCHVMFNKSYGFFDHDNGSWSSKTSQLLYSLTIATKNLCHLESGFQLWRFVNTSSLSALGNACDILESIISDYIAQVQLDLVRRKENGGDKSFRNLSFVEGLLFQETLSPDDIVSNILDTLVIGVNTMSVALGFLLYHLSQNPRVQTELWKEVKTALPESYSRLEYEQLKSLKYLQACLKESLRLKMPMPVMTRVLSRNIVLSNYQIPKGTFVLMTPQAEGMKKENFDDPEEFLPERWLDQEFGHPFAALPMRNYFVDSFERRMAEISLCVCISQIVRQFAIEYSYGDIEKERSDVNGADVAAEDSSEAVRTDAVDDFTHFLLGDEILF